MRHLGVVRDSPSSAADFEGGEEEEGADADTEYEPGSDSDASQDARFYGGSADLTDEDLASGSGTG